MKANHRSFWLRCILFLLCLLTLSLMILPASAAEGTTGKVLGDAVGGLPSAGDIAKDFEKSNPELSAFAGTVFAIDSVDEANVFLSRYNAAVLFAVCGVALVLSLFGCRLIRLAVWVGGFLIGWSLSEYLYAKIVEAGIIVNAAAIPSYVPYLIYLICGILLAFCSRKLLRFGIFFSATAGTFFFLNGLEILNPLIDRIIPAEGDAKYWIARILVSLLVGILSLVLTRPILMITTGAAGGMIAAIALMVALGQTANTNLEMVLGLILAFIGITVQFSTQGKRIHA